MRALDAHSTAERFTSASELLYGLWRQGRRIDELPLELRPRSRAEGYRIQAGLERHTRAPLYGWKIAATSLAGQRHIGVNAPLVGRILSESVIANHGQCSLTGNGMRLAELEFAFRLGRDLPVRHDHYSLEEVMSAVAALHPAIEFPDTRLERFEVVGDAQLIADNACGHLFLLGDPAPHSWRSLDLAAFEVRGLLNERAPQLGYGRNVLGDPRTALAWCVNELSQQATALRAGEIVTTGTCLTPMPIAVGDRLRGDFGVLGEVSVTMC